MLNVPTTFKSVSQGDYAKTTLRAAPERHGLQIRLAISSSKKILTPGQPVLTLTLPCQASDRVAIREIIRPPPTATTMMMMIPTTTTTTTIIIIIIMMMMMMTTTTTIT